ncbi:hypothetical protein DMENIID0001_067530 [Sergentomyia squamirostris]
MKTILVIFVVIFYIQLGLITADPGLFDDVQGVTTNLTYFINRTVYNVVDTGTTVVNDVVDGVGRIIF